MRRAELSKVITATRALMRPEHHRKISFQGARYTVVPLEPEDAEVLLRAAEEFLAIKARVDRVSKVRPKG